ncbi:MAG: hypothetical protein IJ418_01365 [Clostridia bacterium]|nr:hypothetical protein [Clostridia bacterium]
MKPYMEEAARLIAAYHLENVEGDSEQFTKEIMTSAHFDDDSTPEEAVEKMLNVCKFAFHQDTGDVLTEIMDNLLGDIDHRRYQFTDPDCFMTQEEIKQEVTLADNQRNAVLVLARIGRKGKPTRPSHLEDTYRRCQSHARALIDELDPLGHIERPEAPPWRVRHKRNFERDEYIYHARIVEKKTFVQIGKELGISGNAVNSCFQRIERDLRHPERRSSRPDRVAKKDLQIVSVTIEWRNRDRKHQVYDVAKEITSLYRQNNLLKTGQYNALDNPFVIDEISLTDDEAATVFDMAGEALSESMGKDYCLDMLDGSCWQMVITYNNMKKKSIKGTMTAPPAAVRLQAWLKEKMVNHGYKGEPKLLGF